MGEAIDAVRPAVADTDRMQRGDAARLPIREIASLQSLDERFRYRVAPARSADQQRVPGLNHFDGAIGGYALHPPSPMRPECRVARHVPSDSH